MIVKVIERATRNPNNFPALISYLTNTQEKEHRVGNIRMTGLVSYDVKDAVLEVQSTQDRNIRAVGSDVMHIVVSFREGDHPTPEVIQMVEDRMANALGMKEHQRISVVHHDTDQLHLHIAINKIHPKSYRMITPFQSWNKLAQVCLDCERDYGIAPDNHVVNHVLITADNQQKIENYYPDENYIRNQKARDMDFQLESQSLIRFMKDNIKDSLYEAKSWEELHQTLAENGLKIREQANGLVFQSVASGINVKASSISRGLSKTSLEKRLGTFVPSKIEVLPKVQPPPVRNETLYAKYKEEQQRRWAARPDMKAAYQAIRQEAAEARREIYAKYGKDIYANMLTSSYARKMYYMTLKDIRNKELAALKERTEERRRALYKPIERQSYIQWLQVEAANNNIDALLELRRRQSREMRERAKKQALGGEGSHRLFPTDKLMPIDSVTKHGTVIYRCGDITVRDTGNLLHVDDGYSLEVLQTVLKTAQSKFEGGLTLNGSDDFKTQVLIAASLMKEDLVFADPQVQQLYLQMKETAYEEQRHGRYGINARPVCRSNGFRYSVRHRPGETVDQTGKRRRESANWEHPNDLLEQRRGTIEYPDPTKLIIERREYIKSIDPNEYINREDVRRTAESRCTHFSYPRLENLSDAAYRYAIERRRRADVMHEMPGGYVDDNHLVRQEGADLSMHSVGRRNGLQQQSVAVGGQTDGLRRVPSGNRAFNKIEQRAMNAQKAATDYANERNTIRSKVTDVLPHRVMGSEDSGTYKYAGMRHVNGSTIVLFNTGTEMLVKPIRPSEVKSYKAVKVNSSINIQGQDNQRQGGKYGR